MANNYHHGDLRRALIAKTLEFVQQDQVHAIGFRELARQLGVSRSAPYRHFKSVQDLLAAVVVEGYQQFIAQLKSTYQKEEQDPKLLFAQLGVNYVTFGTQHPAHYRIMFDRRYFSRDEYPEIKQLAEESFAILLTAAKQCLNHKPDSQEPYKLAHLAWSTVHGLVKLAIDGQMPKDQNPIEFAHYCCHKMTSLV